MEILRGKQVEFEAEIEAQAEEYLVLRRERGIRKRDAGYRERSEAYRRKRCWKYLDYEEYPDGSGTDAEG